ncbi:glycosyltransferase family 2 protein [Pararhizobium sp. IMCC21322]|uniref:glycosyltransferase family 2 protein n=1 Tax=Pararhizobium sp. IMCC21322 TaxID=3067903 RepID=UPI002741E8ED|nr:glycosyltransferase family 2 protein [Pararhizobium sp. IMCC21322]
MLVSHPLSIFIITLNEADRLGATLEAARQLSDDIVVVDSGSTDNTVQVAKDLGGRVIHNDWQGFGPQKRFAEEQCRHDWLLNLDADEVLSDQAIAEIKALFANGAPPKPGYYLNVVTIYPGKTKPRPIADFYRINRLYDRREMRYSDSRTDDRVIDDGQTLGQIDGPVWHYSFRDISDIAPKMETYARQQIHEKAHKRTVAGLRARMLIEYPVNLMRYLFGRRHITGGVQGVRYAHEIAKSKRKRLKIFLQALQSGKDHE